MKHKLFAFCSFLVLPFVMYQVAFAQSSSFTLPTNLDHDQLRQFLIAKIKELLAQQVAILRVENPTATARIPGATGTTFSEGDTLRSAGQNSYLAPKNAEVKTAALQFEYTYYGDEDFDIGYTTDTRPAIHQYADRGKYSEWRLVDGNDLVATVSLVDSDLLDGLEESFAALTASPNVSFTELAETKLDGSYQIYNNRRDFGYYLGWYGLEGMSERVTLMIVVPFGVSNEDTLMSATGNRFGLNFNGLHFTSMSRAEAQFESIRNSITVYTDTAEDALGNQNLQRAETDDVGYDRDRSEQARYRTAAALSETYHEDNDTLEGYCQTSFLRGVSRANDGMCRDDDNVFMAWYRVYDDPASGGKRYYCIDKVHNDEYRQGYLDEVTREQDTCGFKTEGERSLDEALNRARANAR